MARREERRRPQGECSCRAWWSGWSKKEDERMRMRVKIRMRIEKDEDEGEAKDGP